MTNEALPVAHLNVHSWFSLLSAAPSVEALAARAAQERMTHLALTDTNVLYGVVAFQRACRTANVEPLIGMTATLQAPNGLTLHHSPGELTLLATGPAGYRSLCRLSSIIQATPERAGYKSQDAAHIEPPSGVYMFE